jgi:hypothetical protein
VDHRGPACGFAGQRPAAENPRGLKMSGAMRLLLLGGLLAAGED